jgi:hypothetical protein
MKFHIPENAKLVSILKPAADAAGRTGAYVSLKGYSRAFLIFHVDQGNAATILITPNQATAVAGTGTKAINAVPIWANLDTAASDALARATDAANYTTDAGVKIKQVVFQIDADALDVANSFDCITLLTGASNAANITSAVAILTGARFQQVTPPTAVVD